MQPLNDNERALLRHISMFGSSGYPVRKIGSRWVVDDFFGVKGPPTTYKTKRDAVAQFEAWHRMAVERARLDCVTQDGVR